MANFSPKAEGSEPFVKPIKMLYLGHTGAGKTGSLVALAAAGYNVRILDLDSGVDILEDFVLNRELSPYRKARPGLWTQEMADSIVERISFETITEGYNIVGVKSIPRGDSWAKINQQLNNWTDSQTKQNFGNISKWTSKDILVIDGLSRLCESAMFFQLAINSRLDKGPRVGTSGENDYTAAYDLIRNLLDLLKSKDISCQIIMICHIKYIVDRMQRDPQAKEAQRDLKGFPQTVGSMLAPTIGQYFNHSLRAKTLPAGHGAKRVIVTNNDESIDLKNTAPLRVKQEYDLATGLAEYFQAIRGDLK